MRHSLPSSIESLPAFDAAFWQTVDGGAAALGLTLSAGLRAALDAHARLLVAWNAAINLTALRTADAIARGHLLDSLSAVRPCRALVRAGGGLLDIGSGGGYPGLPLALALGVRRAALVDSVGKKARFLQVAADAATAAMRHAGEHAPDVEALAERAEDLAEEPQHREGWDLVVARAVGSLAEVVELALPLTRIGGHVVAWKRDTADQPIQPELDAAGRVVQAAGGARPRVERADPGGLVGLSGNVLVIVRKIRPTPDRYPRQPSERKRAAALR